MENDWKDRLRELSRDLFSKQVDKNKSQKKSAMTNTSGKLKKTQEEIIREILPKHSKTPVLSDNKIVKQINDIPSELPLEVIKENHIPLPKEPSLTGERITVGLDWGTSVCPKRTGR